MKYVKPELTISKFETEDILTVSNPVQDGSDAVNTAIGANYSKTVDMSTVSGLLK